MAHWVQVLTGTWFVRSQFCRHSSSCFRAEAGDSEGRKERNLDRASTWENIDVNQTYVSHLSDRWVIPYDYHWKKALFSEIHREKPTLDLIDRFRQSDRWIGRVAFDSVLHHKRELFQPTARNVIHDHQQTVERVKSIRQRFLGMTIETLMNIWQV
jgi:hypothetical protein